MAKLPKAKDAKSVKLNEMVEFAKGGIVSKTVAEYPHAKVVLFCMAAGQTLSEHTASVPAIVHTLQGRGRFLLGNEWHAMEPGVWIHMPKGLVHAVEATEDLLFLLTLFRKAE